MKKLVLTSRIGEHNTLEPVSAPSIRAYAKRIGADFGEVTEERILGMVPAWGILQLYEALESYDRVLYISPDCIVRDDCPDLFALVPEDSIGIYPLPDPAEKDLSLIESACTLLGKKPEGDMRLYDSGVIVASQRHRALFARPQDPMLGFKFAQYISAVLVSNNTPVHPLEYQYNRMSCMDTATGEERFASYIIHYTEYPSAEALAPLMKHDLHVWSVARGTHRYQRHIMISVFGGLEAHITAEPAIRYLREQMYPEDDFRIASFWPRVFDHLAVPSHMHNTFAARPGVAYRTIWTMPNRDSALLQTIDMSLCHMV
ncbi:MAG: hypothetical protein AAB964_02240, partial [Patescibacteria group bacterium]